MALAPGDLQAEVGLGQALEEAGRTDEADGRYVRALELGGCGTIAGVRQTAAFQRFAPGQDVGTDFSAEYAAAVDLRSGAG